MEIFGFTFTVSTLWLIGGVGACLSWLVPHWLTNSREHSFRLIDACKIFRDHFISFNNIIRNEPINRQVQAHLLKDIEQQTIIAKEFKRHLGWVQRLRFNSAWKQYELTCHNHPYNRNELEKSIHKLLSFAGKA